MGPGVYTTQSKHTKISHLSDCTKGHKESKDFPSYLNASRGKEGWSTGKPVFTQTHILQIRQLVQFSRDRTWDIQKKNHPIRLVRKSIKKANLFFILNARKGKGKRDRVPVSWFTHKSSFSKFFNWLNSAGMGPGVYKTQSKLKPREEEARKYR
jgi:hypothetical protein